MKGGNTMFKRLGLIVASALTLFTVNASAAVDTAELQAKLDAAGGQLETFAPIVISFVIIMVVIGAFIRLVKKG